MRTYLKSQMNKVLKQWTETELHALLNKGFKDAASSINKDVDAFVGKLKDIYATLSSEGTSGISGKDIASAVGTALLFMLGGGFLDVIISGVYGFGTFAKGLGLAAAMGAVLGFLGFTITLPVAVVAGVLAYVIVIITGGNSQNRSIKNSALQSFRQEIAKPENYLSNLKSITEKVDAFIEEVKKNFKSAIDQDIENANKATEDMRRIAEMGAEARSGRMKEIDSQLVLLQKAENDMDQIADIYQS